MNLELLRELNEFMDETSEYTVSTNGYGNYVLRDKYGEGPIGDEREVEEWLTKRTEYMKKWNRGRISDREITIREVTDEHILFDNDMKIIFFHSQDCCEHNYADFMQLEEAAYDYHFKGRLRFEKVDGCGFRFGDSRRMFFVPCYSEQNGYYSDDVEILLTENYKDRKCDLEYSTIVLRTKCSMDYE